MTKIDKTAADILKDAGRALFPGRDDWQSEIANILNVRRDTVRKWQRGRPVFGPDHGAFRELLAMVAQREAELRTLRESMETMAERNHTLG